MREDEKGETGEDEKMSKAPLAPHWDYCRRQRSYDPFILPGISCSIL
jgi:hypothetical protein